MYILKCADGTFYTGSTKDLERRLNEHRIGEGADYTRKRLPVELFHYEEYQNIKDAYYREQQVKKWSKSKKIALKNYDWESVSKFGKKDFDER
jgi:putative endonuclease